MREKGFIAKFGKEKLKFLAVILFFLFSGVLYSHSFYGGGLNMGTPITAEKIGETAETTVSAEELMGKIDINTASVDDLTTLSGIGEKRAADIIVYREQNGNFHRIEDIMNISGIGEKTFEEIKERITVGE